MTEEDLLTQPLDYAHIHTGTGHAHTQSHAHTNAVVPHLHKMVIYAVYVVALWSTLLLCSVRLHFVIFSSKRLNAGSLVKNQLLQYR